MTRTMVCLAALAALLTGACGDRNPNPSQLDAAIQDGPTTITEGGTPDRAPDHFWDDTFPRDGIKFDTPGTDGPPPKCGPFSGTIGKVCTSPTGCGAGHSCLMIYSSAGLCTKSCIPDDPYTPTVNEDSCPKGNVCGQIQGAGQNYCFHECAPQLGCSECDTGISCHPSAGSYIGRRDKTVCLYGRCTTGADCRVTTGVACKTNAPTCGAGESCQPVQNGSTDGVCSKAGVCDALSGLCAPHKLGQATAKVGDPCKGDVDCGDAMYCLMEFDESKYHKQGGVSCTDNSECCSGNCDYGTCTAGPCPIRYRNGYCTVLGCQYAATYPERACPAGSDCNIIYGGGFCQKTCSLTTASDCRGHSADLIGDYECRAWNKIQVSTGKYASAGPVCDVGVFVPCKTWFSSKQDCSIMGNAGNTTKMACRDLKNTILSNKYDANGFCLDDTASGIKTR